MPIGYCDSVGIVGKLEIITPLAEGQWKLFRQRDTLFCQRGALSRQRGAIDRRWRRPEGGIMNHKGRIMWPEGGIISNWPKGRGVIMIL